MTFPPMKCTVCSGDGYLETGDTRGDESGYPEATVSECEYCDGSGIEPDDDEGNPFIDNDGWPTAAAGPDA